MESIRELVKKRILGGSAEKKRGGINSQRAEMISQLIAFMHEDRPLAKESEQQTKDRINKRMRYWLGRTKKIQPDELYRMMRTASDGKNPPALFNWLLKNKNEKQSI